MTGCTVILFDRGAACGIDVRGSAAGTRQIDALGVAHMVEEAHGILLAGGSAFGLDAAGGVMRYLEERNAGFEVGVTRVPIVPTAVIFDLAFGDHRARPTAQMAYEGMFERRQARRGRKRRRRAWADRGKLFALPRAMKGGVGTASVVCLTALSSLPSLSLMPLAT